MSIRSLQIRLGACGSVTVVYPQGDSINTVDVSNGRHMTMTVGGMPIQIRNDTQQDFVSVQLPRSALGAVMDIAFCREEEKVASIVTAGLAKQSMSRPPSFRRTRTISERKTPEDIPVRTTACEPLDGIGTLPQWESPRSPIVEVTYGQPLPAPPAAPASDK